MLYEVITISVPTDNAHISCYFDNTLIATDALTNNGLGNAGWETYITVTASGTVALSAGNHTMKILGSGGEWQWNLDCINLVKISELPAVSVTGVQVTPLTATLTIGETRTLTPTVAPANATNQAVSWESDRTDIAQVDAAGTVTAVAPGSATITVTTADGGFTASSAITVQGISVTGVQVAPLTATLNVGETRTLTPTDAPANATNQAVSWASDHRITSYNVCYTKLLRSITVLRISSRFLYSPLV